MTAAAVGHGVQLMPKISVLIAMVSLVVNESVASLRVTTLKRPEA